MPDYKIKPYELDKSIRLDRSKLDKPFVTINSLTQASVVSSAIKQNKEYLSTIIDIGFLDVTTYILDFLANSIQGIEKEDGV